MTTPTLALGVSAGGAAQVQALANAVGQLQNNLAALARSGSANMVVGDLGKVTSQLTRMRREMAVGVAQIRTEMASGLKQAFEAAAKTTKEGGDKVESETKKAAAKVRIAAKGIDLGGVIASASGSGLASKDAVAKLAKDLQALPDAVRAAADKTMREQVAFEAKQKASWAEHLQALRARMNSERTAMDQAVAQFRAKQAERLQVQIEFEAKEKARWLAYKNELQARMSQERGMMNQAVAQFRALQAERLNDQIAVEARQKAAWVQHMQDLRARLNSERLMMDQAVAQFRAIQNSKLQAQAEFEAKEKARWLSYRAELQARMATERTMMDQAVRQFRALQEETQNRRIRGSVGQAMTTAGQFSSISAGSYGALRNVPKELDEVADKAPKVAARMTHLTGVMNDAHSAARGLASGFGAIWLTWGRLLPLLAGAAVSNAFVQTIKMGAEVQHTFEIIRVLSEESGAAVGRLNVQMLELARTGPFGPREIAEAMRVLSLAGLDAEKVGSSIKDVLNFSVAGTTSIKQAADVMTSVATAFRISAEGYNYVGDVIAKTAAVSKSSVESIGEAFKTASVVNAQYGATLEDVGVGLALLSNLGIQGTAAGTALRNMYVDILGRTPKVEKALKALGVDAMDPLTGKARGLVEIFKDLDTALTRFTPKSQTKLLQDVFSERGGKEAIAVLDALRAKAKQTGTDVASELEVLKLKIENAAGFMAVSAATLALTPLNQMKSVLATLQASMVESFTALEPYIISTSTRLKELFNSEEFKNALQKMVIAVADLTTAFVNHLDVIAALASAYIAFKVAAGVGSIFTMLSERIALYSLAANQATKATLELTLAQKAASAATATGAGAVAAKAASLSGLLAIGSKVLPWLTAAWLGWEAYSFWTDKSSQANETFSGSTHKALLDSLRSEADRLHEINAAKAQGISLDELRAKKLSQAAESDLNAPVVAAQKKLQDLVEQQRNTAPETATGMRLPEMIRRQTQEVERQKSLADGRKLELQIERNRVATEAQIMKDREKREAEERTKGLLTYQQLTGGANQTHTSTGRGGFGGGGPSISFDNTMSTLDATMRQRESTLRAAYDNETRLLEAKHRGDLVSEGTYQAEVIRLTAQYENEQRALILGSMADMAKAYEDRKLDLTKAFKGEALADELRNLQNTYDKFTGSANAALAKIDSTALTRQQLATISLEAETKKLTQTNADYWLKAEAGVQKEAALANARMAAMSMTDEQRASIEAMTKVEESHTVHIEKLREEYMRAQVALEDFTVAQQLDETASAESVTKFAALQAQVLALARALELSTSNIERLKKVAGETAVKELQNKKFEELSNTIATELSDAILAGGKDGGRALKDWLKNYFIREPLKVFLQAVMQPMGNMFASMALGGGGSSTGVGGNVLGAISQGLFGNIFSSAPGGMLAGTALGGFGAGMGATMTNGLISGFGANMANIGGMLSGGSFGMALGAAMPYIGAVLAVVSMFKDAFKGETRHGGQYNFGNLIAAPSGGEVGEAGKLAQTTADAINKTLKSLGSSSTLTNFMTGLEQSERGKGFAYAGGTLSTGAAFGQGWGEMFSTPGHMNRRGDMTAEEAMKAFGEELKQATLQAIQAATGIPESVMSLLRDKDIDKLAEAELDALITQINNMVTSVDQFRAATMLMPFERLKSLSFDAAAGMIEMAGSVENLLQNLNDYYTNFYSQEEQRLQTAKNIQRTLAEAGLNFTVDQILNSSREKFREVAEAFEGNDEAWSALMSVAGAFATLYPAVENVNNSTEMYIDSLRDQADALQDAIDKFQGYADSLKRFRMDLTMGEPAMLSPAAQYQASRGEFLRLAALAPNNEERLSGIEDAGRAFLEASKAYFASSMPYFTDLAQVLGVVQASENAALTEVQLAQMQLNVLQQQLAALGVIITNTGNTTTAVGQGAQTTTNAVNQGTAAFGGSATIITTAITASAQTTVAALGNLGTAFTGLAGAVSNAVAAPYVPPSSGASFGGVPTVGGAGSSVGTGGVSSGSGGFTGLAGYVPGTTAGSSYGAGGAVFGAVYPSYDVGTPFVPNDGPAMLHRGERVLTARDNAAFEKLCSEVVGLREDNRAMARALASGILKSVEIQKDIRDNTGRATDEQRLAKSAY